MKTILFVLCLLSTTAAFAQYNLGGGSVDSQARSYQFQSHQEHAAYAPMSEERSIIPATTYLSAQGDRRPSDFAQPPETVSLGALAREFRKQHAQLKKARVVWVNQ